MHDFIVGEMRPRGRSSARVADHAGKIADDKHSLVTEILKLPEFSQDDGMAEVQIGRARIHSQFHAEGPAERELLFQFRFADDLRRALFEGGESFSRLHDWNSATAASRLLFVFVK
jgi:hypothetical protein